MATPSVLEVSAPMSFLQRGSPLENSPSLLLSIPFILFISFITLIVICNYLVDLLTYLSSAPSPGYNFQEGKGPPLKLSIRPGIWQVGPQ